MFDDFTQEPLAPVDPRHLFAALTGIGARLDSKERQNVLASFARTRGELHGFDRLDSNEAGLLGVQIADLIQRQRDVVRPEFKWRTFVPIAADAPVGAMSYSTVLWDATGMAELVANYGDDIRKVAVYAKKFSYPIESFALGYDWSIQDVDRAKLAGANYQNRKSNQVRQGFENRWEYMAATGLKAVNMYGLLNNPNVPVIAATSVGGSAVWGSAGKVANDVLNDLLAGEDSVSNTTNDVERVDTALFSLAKFRYLQNTPMFTGAGSNPRDTILKVYLDRTKSVQNIGYWLPLSTADAAGTGPRGIWYKRDPLALHFEMPKAPTELPAQVKNLVVDVNSHAYAGGVVIERPLSAVYMDGM